MIEINVKQGKHNFITSIEKKHITDIELIKDTLTVMVINQFRCKTEPEELDELINLVLEDFEEQLEELEKAI